ncbi:MAG: flippase-like domain-containing protein [Spirochaetes bacterium]|nr:flippase-like domain-containing protein [Spirochaetota bacterium]MBX3721816.1 flippase-like domain-containing protein [Turneriella sp.]
MSSHKKNRIKGLVKFLLTVAISGACLYFAARKIEWQKLQEDLRALNPIFILLAGGVGAIAMASRAFRWHLVLTRERSFAYSTSFWATAIGYLANNILPARAGEIIRSVVLGLGADIRKSLVLATALTERILDAGILMVLAFVMMAFAPQLPETIRKSWLVLLPVIGGVLVLVFLAPLMQNFWLRLVSLLPVGERLREKIRGLLIGLMDGVRKFYHVRILVFFIFISVIIWLTDALGMMLIARSLGSDLTIPQSMIFIAALGFASSVPSTPGYVGVFQAIAVLLLPVFGVSAHRAFLIVSVFQIVLLLVTAAFGVPGWFIMQRRIGAAKLEKELAEEE